MVQGVFFANFPIQNIFLSVACIGERRAFESDFYNEVQKHRK
jgi:hypothetical protein